MSNNKENEQASSFWQRFAHYVHVTDPRTLLYSNDSIKNAIKYTQENDKDNDSSGKYKFHQRIVDATVHPATGEIIPALFRVSAIAPVNIPLVYAMLSTPATNVAATMGLHWFNQSYNAACNYANRSGTSPPLLTTFGSYFLAVGSACSFAYGLGRLASTNPFLKRFGVIIPCIATAAANMSNVGFTRIDEITTGCEVKGEDGEIYGFSKVAGLQCVVQTATTRCFLAPCACLLIPPLAMFGLGKIKLLPKNRQVALLLELGIIYLSLQAALPAALAVYPQTAKFRVTDLEKDFHGLKDKKGELLEYLYANKGL
eukprot:gene8695-11749_t